MRDPRLPDYLAAWTLDKYKKLHIVEKACAMKPDLDWYLHIDADTYVIWPSLVEWLEQLDLSKESFLGSMSYINNPLSPTAEAACLCQGLQCATSPLHITELHRAGITRRKKSAVETGSLPRF
jgi:hypothetical protein